jgi:hypothetical protein
LLALGDIEIDARHGGPAGPTRRETPHPFQSFRYSSLEPGS